jgi:transglutaminase-like putative cysteine protease
MAATKNEETRLALLHGVGRKRGPSMLIRYGYDIEVELFQSTTLVAAMDVHSSRRRRLVRESDLQISQSIPVETFVDDDGNVLRRLTAEAGNLSLKLDGVFTDSGAPDEIDRSAEAWPVSALPPETLPFLLGSRYCETDLLSDFAWGAFGSVVGGWARVQAICDYVHQHLTFSYPNARPTRTASQAMQERIGVCRDFTHLAVTLCRCLNIPARYCNGYLGDIGVPPDPAPMDFNAWFEAFLGGRWFTFDARHNCARIGRILIARGRDAMDVPMIASFGAHRLNRFTVVTEEVPEDRAMMAA